MNTTSGLRVATLAGLLVAGGALSAGAAPISGTGQLGSFTGDLTYTATSNTEAKLVVKLTNTSALANGGYITAFVLNNPNDRITRVSSLGDAGGGGSFELIGLGNNFVSAAPHGQFDFGASTSGGFEGGGKPQAGIGVNGSDTLTFYLTGTNLLDLSADSFLTALSSGTGSGGGYAAIDVRFRGFMDGGSDKVTFTGTPGGSTPGGGTTPGTGTPGTGTPGTGTPGTGTPGTGTIPGGAAAVPEPGSIALLGAGLAALGAVLRRRART